MDFDQLTATEARVAALIGRGCGDREISTRLGLDETVCGRHLAEIYRKLGLRSRTELALLLGHDTEHRTNTLRAELAPPRRETR